MSAEDVLVRALAEHETLCSDDYTVCCCGAEATNLAGLRAHVAAAQVTALREAGYLPEPVEGVRTYASPATEAQRRYVDSLLRERIVPIALDQEVSRVTLKGLTDGDCRRIIPLLEECEERGRWSPRPPGPGYGDDHDMGDWEDWRDHPDAIAGDPYEHGSH
jgi:hypothetical protein